ncbi:MAG: hypothetical protein NT105_02640 [Verrucomicrobia bacterium]|nr:hypothetical protein [Verrucomicrobiota bacterium]
MIFSSRKLEEALAANLLSPWEKTKYLVFGILVCGISYPLVFALPNYNNQSFSISTRLILGLLWVVNILVVYRGVRSCFQTNSTIDNSAFVERFIILNFPVFIKYWAILIPLILGSFWRVWMLRTLYPNIWDSYREFLSVLTVIATYLFYVFLNRSFARLGARIGEQRSAMAVSCNTPARIGKPHK